MQPKLGAAFYTNVSAAGPDQPAPSAEPAPTGGSSNTGGGSGSGGGSGNNGGSTTTPGGNNGGGSTTTPPAASSGAIADLAANVNVGNTKTQINGQANNLGSSCAVVADANGPTVGKQEVCTYSQGDKIITVTYLNDRVVSASKSGF